MKAGKANEDISFGDVKIDDLSDEEVVAIFAKSMNPSTLRSMIKSMLKADSALRSTLKSTLRGRTSGMTQP